LKVFEHECLSLLLDYEKRNVVRNMISVNFIFILILKEAVKENMKNQEKDDCPQKYRTRLSQSKLLLLRI